MNYYYWMDVVSGGIHKLKKSEAFNHMVIVRAPSKKAFWDAVEKAKGGCVKCTPLNEIKMDIEREFLAGGLVRFRGTPINIVNINCWDYLKIAVTKDIFIYHVLIDENCYYLELI